MAEKSILQEVSERRPSSDQSIPVDTQQPASLADVSSDFSSRAESHHLAGWRLHFTTAGSVIDFPNLVLRNVTGPY